MFRPHILLAVPVFMRLISGYAETMPSEAAKKEKVVIQLSFTINPQKLPAADMADMSWSVKMKNVSAQSIDVYPDLAKFDIVAGWAGPFWRLQIHKEDEPQTSLLRQLRTYYGPPPGLPPRGYFTGKETTLRPGGQFEQTWQGCWVPNKLLQPAELTVDTLDPEGNDELRALKFDLSKSHVIVLHSNCEMVRDAMQAGTSFLRPGQVIFIPQSGSYIAELTYSQERDYGTYQLPSVVETSSPPVVLAIP